MASWCIVHGGIWACVPTSCHVLPRQLIPILQAEYPDDTIIETPHCQACGGGGCKTGLSETLCKILPKVMDKAKEVALIKAAVKRITSRRRDRRRGRRTLLPALAALTPGVVASPWALTGGNFTHYRGASLEAHGFIAFCLDAKGMALASANGYTLAVTGPCHW